MHTVTLNNPNYEPGVLLDVVGLGAFANGEATEVPVEAEEKYYGTMGQVVADIDSEAIEVSGTGEFTAPAEPAPLEGQIGKIETVPPATPPVEPSKEKAAPITSDKTEGSDKT